MTKESKDSKNYIKGMQSLENIETIIYNINPSILEWMGIVENWILPPINSYDINTWSDEALTIAETLPEFSFLEEEWIIIYKLLYFYEKKWEQSFQDQNKITDLFLSSQLLSNLDSNFPLPNVENLLSRRQTQQRTSEWYSEQLNLITASEIGDVLESSPQSSTYLSLVRSKILPKDRLNSNSAVPSEYMTPFDWGIRFEPVVKQIYSHLYNITIEELGRLYHPTMPRVAASPDGLIRSQDSKWNGSLIEIKCPVTRKPDGRILPKYYHQVQLQLEVTNLNICYFTECIFLSPYKDKWENSDKEIAWVDAVKKGALHGQIYLIESQNQAINNLHNESQHIQEKNIQYIYSHRYAYSPINDLSWRPIVDEQTEHIVETIPWALLSNCQQKIQRDTRWWEHTKMKISEFWETVDKMRKEYEISGVLPQKIKTKNENNGCNISFL